MEIIRRLNKITGKFPNLILTLGTFDGIHKGHQAILKALVEKSRRVGGTAGVFTFNPHPRRALGLSTLPSITPLKKKLQLLQYFNLELVIIASFTPRFAAMEAEEFVEKILWKQLRMKEIFVGPDCAFGHQRRGNAALLKEMGNQLGFIVHIIPSVKIDDQVVSSTRIRELLLSGNLAAAEILLGRKYSLLGRVTRGKRRGRLLGYPTANIKSYHGAILPPTGVYAVKVLVNIREYGGMLYIGTRPTFGEKKLAIEVYIFGFTGNLLHRELEITFWEKIRPEITFPSVKALKEQLTRDELKAREILNLIGFSLHH